MLVYKSKYFPDHFITMHLQCISHLYFCQYSPNCQNADINEIFPFTVTFLKLYVY